MTTESQGQFPLKTEINAIYLEILDENPLTKSERISLAAGDIGQRAVHITQLTEKVDAHSIISGRASRFGMMLRLLRSPDLLTNIDVEKYAQEKESLQSQIALAHLALKTSVEGVRVGYKLTRRQTKKAIKMSRKNST